MSIEGSRHGLGMFFFSDNFDTLNEDDAAFRKWLEETHLKELEDAYLSNHIYKPGKRAALWRRIVKLREQKHLTGPENTIPPDLWDEREGMSQAQFKIWIRNATRSELEHIYDEFNQGNVGWSNERWELFWARARKVGGLRGRERVRSGPTGNELIKHGSEWGRFGLQLLLGFGLLGGGTMLAGGAMQRIQNGELERIYDSGEADLGFVLLVVGAFVCLRAGWKWLNSSPPSTRQGFYS